MCDREETDIQLLFTFVVANNVKLVEQWLKNEAQAVDRRAIIRTELDLRGPIAYHLRECHLVSHLMSYQTSTLTAFHLAALLGHNDILVNLLDRDVPVDSALEQGGGTALHFASLGGQLETVNMLHDVYKADVNATDSYGWTALHYAGAQGHLPVAKALVAAGVDFSRRDQDGTTAAYRAHVAHHTDILHYLCTLDGATDLLRIDGDSAAKARGAKVNVRPVAPPGGRGIAPPPDGRARLQRTLSDGAPSVGGVGRQLGASMTLPARMRKDDRRSNDVRRLIQRELELAFESDYEQAVGAAPQRTNGAVPTREMQELRIIVRDELHRYRGERSSSRDGDTVNNSDDEEEDPYSTLAEIRDLPPAPLPPALPPRNSLLGGLAEEAEDAGTVHLIRQDDMLREALVEVAAAVGTLWPRLARQLPVCRTPAQCDGRVRAIEARYPGDAGRQAAVMLAEWRINEGKEAATGRLTAALRRCGLQLIADRVNQIEGDYEA